MPSMSTTSRTAAIAARLIEEAFSTYRAEFLEVTRRARGHFEARTLAGLRRDAPERLQLYRLAVDRAERRVKDLLGPRMHEHLLWVSMKAVFSSLIEARQDWELAETFYNSITRRVFTTVGVDPDLQFVDTDFDAPPVPADEPITKRYDRSTSTEGLCGAVLWDTKFYTPWRDRTGDARKLGDRIDAWLASLGGGLRVEALEMLRPVFYHGAGAYLVGRLHAGGLALPIAIALSRDPEGVAVDAALLDEADVSILFSFTRSYFHVATTRPHAIVQFLASLMPRKPRAELYISIGEPKHGKTELFRALRRHLEVTTERFHTAEGIRGLVMVVFTLPGHDIVLKVIRDVFPPEKKVSPERVRERYQWVYTHDRAGRLVDAQAFEHLQFPVDRFEPDLLAELLTECSRTVRRQGDQIVIELAYIERKVTPLDLHLRRASRGDAEEAVLEYGEALRDLAACNIFPGDLLLKNFGVTRRGRVAFYDYDELEALTDCRFRDLPEAETWEQEMASEPWYNVAPEDVFPEEFVRFLGLDRQLKQLFLKHHGELLTAAWWRSVQQRLQSGEVVDFLPYPARRRLEGRP
jgi:isocitrate dehydrogenase kinase/phosphatase